ncbi:MAG TPA: SWIM zinc finger family protein [Streptosporangiaceae bacterium]|nr:SWIM zinc finger family protein [Streptosporangiaceae bacterium]
MAERWDEARVLAQAPDASSQRSARPLAAERSWLITGAAEPEALWGECKGSAAAPYRTAVDLTGPRYKCSCPSRKFPCKHALALMLLWSAGRVEQGTPPDWAATWLQAGAARTARDPAAEPADPAAAQRRAEQREQRVLSGLDELDQWLRDQVRQGLATTPRSGYQHWDTIAARMVDAQASGLAERLRGLAAVPYSGPGWESRLLEEYALLRLLITAYRRRAELPAALTDTVRSRIGFTVRQADVLSAGEHVKDHWQVLARRDLEQDRIRTRRTWLRGTLTSRYALLLSFAAGGESFDISLTVGSETDLELAFYPGALPLRALSVTAGAESSARPPAGGGISDLLAGWARALAADPWLEVWPAVLSGVIPARIPAPSVTDETGTALPLHPALRDSWPLFALSAGRPLTLAGEWTPRGLWPLTAWAPSDSGGQGRAVVL